MAAKIHSAAVVGLDAIAVEVEVDIAPGLGSFTVVGLGDTAIQEARERVRSAMKNSGLPFPRQKLTVNLAPADIRKAGPAYDLPIALGILSAVGVDTSPVLPAVNANTVVVGELALDGAVRRVDGILSIAVAAKSLGKDTMIVPLENAPEAALIEGLTVIGVRHLNDAVAHLRQEKIIPAHPRQLLSATPLVDSAYDIAFIQGQETAKRVLEIACAGAHNLFMSGPPGGGKTMLAKTLPTILPAMSMDEQLEVTRIYSVAGLLDARTPTIIERPFRSPHHTASDIALVGGGANPRPGEVSLAHRGVLFLDELPEFSRSVIEALRQPIEDGVITVSRAASTLQFPAKFMFVATQNPCPCGYYGDARHQCTCTTANILRYQKKVSGPLLDRIDLAIDVPAVETEKLMAPTPAARQSPIVRARIQRAREIQRMRFQGTPLVTNSEMSTQDIARFCPMSPEVRLLLTKAVDRYRLSARGFYRLLKVARTIADLEEAEAISTDHAAEALQYRLRKTDIS